MHAPYVAVIGASVPEDPSLVDLAAEAGRLLAERGWVLVTGGLGGVMAAAASGAAAAGGAAVAILPGLDRAAASPGHTVVVPTGMGEMRNALIVRSVDAVLAVGGSWGTLSEIGFAARTGVPVFAVAGWGTLPGDAVVTCDSVAQAVQRIAAAVG